MLRKYADTKVEEYVCVKHDLTYLYLYGGFSGHDYLINSWVTKVNMINSLWSSEIVCKLIVVERSELEHRC